MPNEEKLKQALLDAAKAHHDYEQKILNGERDEHWPGWYAAYVLGRYSDLASPSELTNLLKQAAKEHDKHAHLEWADWYVKFLGEHVELKDEEAEEDQYQEGPDESQPGSQPTSPQPAKPAEDEDKQKDILGL